MNNQPKQELTGRVARSGAQPQTAMEVTSRPGFRQQHALRDVLRIVRKRYRWIGALIAICLSLAIGLSFMMKPTYASTATIELNKSGVGSMDLGVDDSLSQQLMPDAENLLTELQTETSILQSDSLALDVIKRLKLADQPPFADPKQKSQASAAIDDDPEVRGRLLGTFLAHLKVRPIRGTRLIAVTYESHDNRQAATIANALIDSYKNHYLQSHYTATSEASDWLTKQLDDLKKNVEDSEQKLTDFEKESGIVSLNLITPTSKDGGGGSDAGIHSVIIEKLDALNAELTKAESNRIEKEAIYRFAKSGNADVIIGIGSDPLATQSDSAVLNQGGGVSGLSALRMQEGQLKVAYANAATKYGSNNRHLNDLQVQLKEVQGQIQEEIGRIVKRAEVDYNLAVDAERSIRGQFEKQQQSANKVNEDAVRFAVLSQEAFSRKRLYDDLYTRLQEANVSAGIKATNITIADPARPQSHPVRPNLFMNSILGVMFGGFFGIICAFLVDNLDRTVTTAAQVEEITGWEVIGVIPSASYRSTRGYRYRGRLKRETAEIVKPENAGIDPTNWMIHQPNSELAESIRSLRTSIMLSRPGAGPSVILVTSSLPGEGKTTLTWNLAVAFAQRGLASTQHTSRVLVIEGDMRRPKMRRMTGLSGKRGLSNVLTGNCTIDEAISPGILVPTLDVLSSGPHPPMPSEILGSQDFESLLNDLRSRYDYIVVDSPPALLVTDPILISTKVDAVVWVARAGVVTKPLLTRSTEVAYRAGMPLIGYVINGVDYNSADYRYDYGYRGANGYYDNSSES